MMSDPAGCWYVRIDGEDIPFQHGTADSNPLDEVEAFDRGEHYSFDIKNEVMTRGIDHKTDPQDDVFVLIEKERVEDVFFKPHDDEDDDAPNSPTRIGRLRTDDVMDEDETGE